MGLSLSWCLHQMKLATGRDHGRTKTIVTKRPPLGKGSSDGRRSLSTSLSPEAVVRTLQSDPSLSSQAYIFFEGVWALPLTFLAISTIVQKPNVCSRRLYSMSCHGMNSPSANPGWAGKESPSARLSFSTMPWAPYNRFRLLESLASPGEPLLVCQRRRVRPVRDPRARGRPCTNAVLCKDTFEGGFARGPGMITKRQQLTAPAGEVGLWRVAVQPRGYKTARLCRRWSTPDPSS